MLKVLDEADRLLDPSFAADLATILAELPSERQTLLFTATITSAMLALEKSVPSKGKDKPFLYTSDAKYAAMGMGRICCFNPDIEDRGCYACTTSTALCFRSFASSRVLPVLFAMSFEVPYQPSSDVASRSKARRAQYRVNRASPPDDSVCVEMPNSRTPVPLPRHT